MNYYFYSNNSINIFVYVLFIDFRCKKYKQLKSNINDNKHNIV